MPRAARDAPAGQVYHGLNRGVGRQRLFFIVECYLACQPIIVEKLKKRGKRSYCRNPNHWRFVTWPEKDGDPVQFMQRLAIILVTRQQRNDNIAGYIPYTPLPPPFGSRDWVEKPAQKLGWGWN